MSAAPLFGIDFGTTNSTMAQALSRDRAEVVLDSEGLDKIPSLVFYGERETLVGARARNFALDANGDSAVESRLIRCIKRNILRPPVIGLPGGRTVRPPEVAAEILGKLRRDAEAAAPDARFDRVVIACPATFDGTHAEALLEAAHLTGFDEVEIIEEPVAAALAFDSLGGNVGSGVLVFDFGGGTFDAAFVVREPGESTFHLALEPDGDPQCGGEDLDLALYAFFDAQARERFGRGIADVDGMIDYRFLDECRRRKEHLSRSRQVSFSIMVGDHSFRTSIERAQFEELIKDPVEVAVDITCRLAERAAAELYKVDTVLLVGGSSQVPLVKRRLQERLGIEPLPWGRRDIAVALGCAFHATAIWAKPSAERGETGPKPVPANARNLIQRGDSLRQNREFERAIAQYDEAIAIAPQAIEAHYGRGEARLGLHQLELAVSHFDAALQLDPGYGRALVGRARANTERYRTEESMADLALALAIEPEDGDALVARGWAYCWSERDDEAIVDFERALAIEAGCADALAGLGIALMSRDASQSLTHFERALEADPRCLWALLGAPMVNWDADSEQAAAGLERVLALDPDWPLALAFRGLLLADGDDLDGAAAVWERALAINPDEAVALGLRGLIHALNERHDAALADLDRAVELAPWWAILVFFRGVAAAQRGEHETAIAEYDFAQRVDDSGTNLNLPDVLARRGVSQAALGHAREAIADLDRVIELAPSADHFMLRAETHAGFDDHDAALRDAREAVRLAPGSEDAHAILYGSIVLGFIGRAHSQYSAPHAAVEARRAANRQQLERSELEKGWFSDQRAALSNALTGTEELIWLGRCSRTTDVMRQVALLVTSERVLWCRGTLRKGPDLGFAGWKAIESVEDIANGFVIHVDAGDPFVIGFNQIQSGIDFSGHGLVSDADDLRILMRTFKSFCEE